MRDHADERAALVNHRHGADVALHHEAGDLTQRSLRADGDGVGCHHVSHRELAQQLDGIERRECQHLLGPARREERQDVVRARERTGEGTYHLQVERRVTQRCDDENHDPGGAVRVLLPADRRGRDAERGHEAAHRLRAKVGQERVLSHAHHVLGPGVSDHGVQPLGVGHRAARHQALGEPLGSLLDRGGAQGNDDVLWLEDVAQLHSRSFSRATTSTGRFITAMPAWVNAAIFSAAVPLDPAMMAPACPMRRPGGAVCPAMNPITGLDMAWRTKSAACCSSVPPISPITTTASVSGSAWNAERQWMKLVPMRGSPPMPTQVDGPYPAPESWCTIS